MFNFTYLSTQLEEIGSTEVDNAASPFVQKRTRIFPLSLCTVPPEGLTSAELKKRYIISAILNSENSYILSMQRLVNVSYYFINFYNFLSSLMYNYCIISRITKSL